MPRERLRLVCASEESDSDGEANPKSQMLERDVTPNSLRQALAQQNGAHFYKVALQVNPYDYVTDNKKPDQWGSEEAYNAAMVDACLRYGIVAIGVTDHHRISSSVGLIDAAGKAGVTAFPGFEVETKEGVHFLCLFEPGTEPGRIERYLGDCGVFKPRATEPCQYDISELLERVRVWGGIPIAAHIFSSKGLLSSLKGSARANAWRNANLVAAGIPGPVADVAPQFRAIIENTEASYKRDVPVALLNCNDVASPSDLGQSSSSCLIKMSTISVEALRQAFLDPQSRIRLHSDQLPDERTELLALSWEGGFLDGLRIHFNSDLNVFVGGRGTGKSSILESIRYVLNARALGPDARDAHDKLIRNVVGSGTKISLLVESHRPARKRYCIERTVPNAPTVRDNEGQLLSVSPLQIVAGIEIFGQHEITEVTRSRKALTELLGRFADPDPSLDAERVTLANRLEESRASLLRAQRERMVLAERVAALPSLRETQQRYKEAGIEERLREQSIIVREEQAFRAFDERVGRVDEILRAFDDAIPVDMAFLSEAALREMPGRDILAGLRPILESLAADLTRSRDALRASVVRTRDARSVVRAAWEVRRADVQDRYEKILRELHKAKIDGEEFIRLRRQIEELTPLVASQRKLDELIERALAERTALLSDWDELLRRQYRRLAEAAKRVSRKLGGRLRIAVRFMGNQETLHDHLRKVKFRDPETPVRRDGAEFSLRSFADSIAQGADEITRSYRYSQSQSDRIVEAGAGWRYQLEELELPSTTHIELNIGSGQQPEWRQLSDLSTGQKATAVLLLLLIESDAPLVVDQPEDDLDNRFISDSVVPRIREAKGHRQFILATHNANIPVLGDAELIAGLTAIGEAGMSGRAYLADELVGSIDKPSVAAFAEEILEGGKTAFVTRKQKYGF